MVDQAGNYIFESMGEQHRVMNMGIKKQRDFMTRLGASLSMNDLGEHVLHPMTEAFNSAQDELMHLIYHRDDSGKWSSLDFNSDYLEQTYIPKVASNQNMKPLDILTTVFAAMVECLTVNFTETGQESDLTNSSHLLEEESETQNTPNLLSQTLPT